MIGWVIVLLAVIALLMVIWAIANDKPLLWVAVVFLCICVIIQGAMMTGRFA